MLLSVVWWRFFREIEWLTASLLSPLSSFSPFLEVFVVFSSVHKFFRRVRSVPSVLIRVITLSRHVEASQEREERIAARKRRENATG
jgi:hypothetical protein